MSHFTRTFEKGTPRDHQLNEADRQALSILLWVALIPSSVLSGWVGATLWRWFVAPLGAPSVGVFHMMGISCLLFLLTSTLRTYPKNDGKESWERSLETLIQSLLTSAICLGMGFIYHILGSAS